ncbi:hypothetical protein [Endozoicomonas sp. GU-1]|uniref:hypothetical protein n=1 Tax=Endozoicomonas sp. GU-1 TaxID=3009078 RepID=UPI0022B5B838|nr:hypothetical protein [Endozoicomonas sp. GU-1]WBA82245.1 hypothetical protein O2T12_03540 [Endozoicomonas sp. GU-1]WBA85182.1 hypothetical protein O3276_18230 [Endozoicomonas sp. GU-1]
MATTNIWQQFKARNPEGVRVVATITANNGNGTSEVGLRDGSVITVKGESVGVGQDKFIRYGEIKGAAPNSVQYEVDERRSNQESRAYSGFP